MALQRVAAMFPDPAGPLWSVVLLAGLTLPLAWRRRYPYAVLAVVSTVFIVAGELMVPEQVIGNIALFVAIYTVGSWVSERRTSLIVWLAVVDVMFLWLVVILFMIDYGPPFSVMVTRGTRSMTVLGALL